MSEILDGALPYYMSLGMTPEEYWHGEPNLPRAYIKTHKLRLQQTNQLQWRNGQYMMLAIAQALSGKEIYPSEPLPMSEAEAEEREVLRNNKTIQSVMDDLLFGVNGDNGT